ncbi:MAG: glycoside hydrolase, partial [Algoriphagus sp.]
MNKPIFTVILIAFSLFSTLSVFAQETDRLPIKGFAIAAPSPDEVDRFVKFIDEELGTRGVNTLVLRVDY